VLPYLINVVQIASIRDPALQQMFRFCAKLVVFLLASLIHLVNVVEPAAALPSAPGSTD
jgi:hypothetical protein